jgi:hypothetical protein
MKDDDPVQLRMADIYDHSFVSTIQHHVHHISNSQDATGSVSDQATMASQARTLQ